jgi:WD40 repeat protein
VYDMSKSHSLAKALRRARYPRDRLRARSFGLPLVTAGAFVAALLTAVPSSATQPREPVGSPLRHSIVYTRFLPGADTGTVLRLDPGQADPTVIRDGVLDYALLSPDAKQFTTFAPTADDRASACLFDLDGSGYRALEIPDPTLGMPGGMWSLGTERLVGQGFDPADASRAGLYSRRTADGGDLIRLTDPGTRADWPVAASPDGRKFLFLRPHAKDETSDSSPQDAFVVNAEGGNLTRLTPQGVTTAFAFGAATATWSPDSKHVAMAAAAGSFWANSVHAVYIVDADGTHARRVGPRGNVWDAAWSPDGQWIAFSMNTDGTFQLYVMHPDGTGVRKLTPGHDGQSSVAPTWSPGSDQLVFHRWTNDPRVQDVWSINADGSQLFQVTHEPAGYGSGPGLAWLP